METTRASRHSQRAAAAQVAVYDSQTSGSSSGGKRRPSHEAAAGSPAGGALPQAHPVVHVDNTSPTTTQGSSRVSGDTTGSVGRKRKYNTRSASRGEETPAVKESPPKTGRSNSQSEEAGSAAAAAAAPEEHKGASASKKARKGSSSQQNAAGLSRQSGSGRRKSAAGSAQTTSGDTTGSCASSHAQHPSGSRSTLSVAAAATTAATTASAVPTATSHAEGTHASSTGSGSSRQHSSHRAHPSRNFGYRMSSGGRQKMQQQNEPMENDSQSGGESVQNNSNNNAMDAQSGSNAFAEGGSTGAGEDGDNRLRELLESRGIPPHLLGALGPRMQHFLHRYVGTIGGVSNLSSGNTRATQLLESLRSTDQNDQLQGVIAMCDTLMMGNEDSLPGFPFKSVIPVLVELLSGPTDGRAPNFEIMHHACRALTHMMDTLPRSTGLIAESIPKFVEKLESIQCMDVAEQSLTALEMLSKRHAKAILHANGVAGCLGFLDFFSINAQRAALTITANCCAHLGPDDWSLVKPSVPLLSQRLDPINTDNPDKKSVECVCAALSRIVEAFQGNAEVLQEMAPRSTLDSIQALLLRNPPLVSSQTFVIVIRMLALLCQGCPSIAGDLLESNIDETIRHMLIGAEKDDTKETIELLPRSPQELYEITGLIMELMPRLPDDGVFAIDQTLWNPQGTQSSHNNVTSQAQWSWQDNNMEWQPYSLVDSRCIESAHDNGEEEVTLSINGKTYTLNFSSMQQTSEDSGTSRTVRRTVINDGASSHQSSGKPKASINSNTKDVRKDFVKEKPEVIAKFVHSLMNILYEIYGSSAGPTVRHKCLRAMLRIVYYTDSATLEGILKADSVSNHLSQMLSAHNDVRVTVMALQLTEILMQKMPQMFIHPFNREGVLHKISELSARTVEPLELPTTSQGGDMSSSGSSPSGSGAEPSTSADRGADSQQQQQQQQNAAFGQRIFGDMLKRKRTSGAAASANDKKRPSDSRGKDPRKTKGQDLKRAGPATRSRLSVHGDLESPEDQAPKPSGSGQNSAPGSSNASPVSMRFASSSGNLLGEQESHSSKKNAASAAGTGGGCLGGAGGGGGGGGGFLSMVQSRFGKWGNQSPSAQPAASSSTLVCDRQASLHQQQKKHRQEVVRRIKQWIHEESICLKENYFANYTQQLCTSTLEKLEKAVALVKAGQNDSSVLAQGLKAICEVLQEGDVSSFELIHSGMVAALSDLFAHPGSEEFSRNAKIMLQVFAGVDTNLSVYDARVGPIAVPNATPLLNLVTRLNSCVSQLEQFALKVHDVPGGVGGTRGTSALRFFNTHQLKCNLERHPSCTNLKSWKSGPVKIDPLALVQAIERYLVVRGYGRVRDDDDGGSEEDNSDEDLDESMMLGTSQGHNRHRLQFLIGETPLQYNMTVYEAIKQYSHLSDGSAHSEADLFDVSFGDTASSAVWTQTHTIYYKPAASEEIGQNGLVQRKKNKGGSSGKKQSVKDDLWNEGTTPAIACPIEGALASGKLHETKLHDPSLSMLSLLRLLYTLSHNWGSLYGVHHFVPAVQEEVFLNAKMSNKSLRQLQDPLALMTGNIPHWLKTLSAFCPFVMPFETRHNLFYSTCFDRDRALQRLMDNSPELSAADSSERVTPRLDRKKRTVNRDDLLKQAETVFNEISINNSRPMLEIQYENEVGSGLGPTLEFYALVSRELQRCDLEMWRNQRSATERALCQKGGAKEFVLCPGGLYPNPLARNVKSSQLNKIKNRFKMSGKFVAKALMDSRMLDMHFSVPMFKWMLGDEKTLSLRDLQYIDEELFKHLCNLQTLVEQKNRIIAQNRNAAGPALAKSLEKITLDGCQVELLGLDFTLPGHDIELKKGGSNIAVTIHNLDQYIKLVVHWSLVEGVRRQMEAFKEGFESIFPIENLGHYFRPFELNRALCGDSPAWSHGVLRSACKIDHGYTVESRAIQFLFEIMEEFDEHQRRDFLLFVTGSPRLPVGGFRALAPPLTIVKKTGSEGISSDGHLPSVMTCVNYFKLPDYSSKDVMRDRLLMAQSDGQGSFLLS